MVVNNKKKFFGEYFQEDEREKTGGLTTYPGQSLCEVYPAKKKKKKKFISGCILQANGPLTTQTRETEPILFFNKLKNSY